MATLRNRKKVAAINRDNHVDQRKNIQARNTNFLTIQEDYIIQVTDEIGDRFTKKLCQEFSRTENRNLSALSRLGEFFLNTQARTHSRAVPETFRNLS